MTFIWGEFSFDMTMISVITGWLPQLWLRLHRSSQARGILSRLVGTYAVQVFVNGISSLSEVFGACGRRDR